MSKRCVRYDMSGLMNAIWAAKDQRLQEKGAADASPEQASELLRGECMENAAAIRDEFHARGIECRVVGGALRSAYPPDETPDSFAEAKADGFGVHYWVEAQNRICEIASESSQYFGQAIAVQVEPTDLGYIVFDDSTNPDISY